jgi:benzylsuccinate CoA-transferase BbsF subunit
MGGAGPWRNYTGFGPTVQALSGLTQLTSFPGGPPLGPGLAYADHIAGLYASVALLGALEHRRQTGRGQHIDISQVEAVTSLLGDAVVAGAGPCGNGSPRAAPHNVYRCAGDSRVAVAVYTAAEWLGLRRALGNPPWAGEEKYATLAGRLASRAELDGLLEEWTNKRTAAEAVDSLRRHGVAAGVVQDAAALAADPHLLARGFFVGGKAKETVTDAVPIKMSHTPAAYRRTAPAPGRDNDYVYRGLLGLSDGEMAALRDGGVI